jgi:hypothetical protein
VVVTTEKLKKTCQDAEGDVKTQGKGGGNKGNLWGKERRRKKKILFFFLPIFLFIFLFLFINSKFLVFFISQKKGENISSQIQR